MQRLPALDIAKGIAILLVVLFHTVRGFENAGLISPTFGLRVMDNAAYAVNVQIFFLIAGYLVYPMTSNLRFQIGRFFTLYYPYITWSLLSWAIAFALSNAVSSPTDVEKLLLIPIDPFQHYWFLLALIIGTAMLYFTQSAKTLVIGAGIAALYSATGFDWTEGGYAFVFMATGALLRLRNLEPPADLAAAFFGMAAVLICACFAPQFDPSARSIIDMRSPLLIPICLAGCYTVYAASVKLQDTTLGNWLGVLGEMSMPIYLTHILFGSGARIVFFRLMPDASPIVGLFVSLAAAFAGPIMVAIIANRFNLSRVSGFEALPVHGNQRPRPRAMASA